MGRDIAIGEARTPRGFTLLEVIIVLTVVAILVSVAIPAYQRVILRAREAVLKQNLHLLRSQIEEFAADYGRYPESLQELVEKGYLRELPLDPITGSRETWVPVPEDQPLSVEGKVGIRDVKSGAEGLSSEGTPYSEW
ncbi:MAG: prepilin-type N-terminal cleavage/methylation domain-containing protein [Blastocatellia bacterium]|nr:prepilin-type N-terminal cleavage/methylation domain-containing protein [Blastocatellia bacterium]MCS7157622.1 prepilin-type N-terminal cleavage/methylation domain-containing protein [Blastocatellia bacterium]MCX7751887.1 prepilin-type N-terminal cleavage/methylation domain-containing protein [Blastocatellia bacterium]MDW8166993.1 prepilin-type N-terminal cleavage/methylation domain-containing protein [Acidobacteriota bacterium]MDW8257097.1 prepilin-type N-terminal cleavage/methylation domai